MTELLSERQQTARAFAREIGAMSGAWVTSASPLSDDARLRFQVLDGDKNRVLQAIRDLGFEPGFVSILPRVTFNGMAAACLYEIDLPRPRIPVYDDRKIYGEIAEPKKKTDVELEHFRRNYLGLK